MGLPAALALGQVVVTGAQAYRQNQEARRLQREGPQDPTPLAFREAQEGAANLANNSQVGGYGVAIDEINQDAASAMGEARRAGVSASDVLNTNTRLFGMKQKAKRGLMAQGQQEQRLRRAQLNAMLERRAGWQEQGRQEQARAIGALLGASQQNLQNALTGAVGVAAYGKGTPGSGATPFYDVETMDTMQVSPMANVTPIPSFTPSPVPMATGNQFDIYNQFYRNRIPSVTAGQ